jgi:predicted peptidase
LVKEYGLDGRRIYVGGFSMGGCGAWEMLTRYPDLFAAAFPSPGRRATAKTWLRS